MDMKTALRNRVIEICLKNFFLTQKKDIEELFYE